MGDGSTHLAIAVGEIEAVLRRLSEIGVAPDRTPYHPGEREDLPLIAFVTNPYGYRVELIDGGAFDTPQDPVPSAFMTHHCC